MGTLSLISDREALKHHQSGVDGDMAMEGLGEGLLGRNQRHIILLIINI